MAKRGDLPTRSEIEDNVEKHKESMSEQVDELDIYATDTETVRDTRDSLDVDLTADGADQMLDSMDSAEDVTIDAFEREDDQLDQIMDEAQEYSDELNERQDSARDDLEKISDGSSRIETSETVNELAHAKAAVMEDMDFLDDNEKKAEDAQNETEQARKALQQRIDSGRRN
jgi:hypothetical protein